MSFRNSIHQFLSSENRLSSRSYLIRWFVIIFILKLILFVYFARQFQKYGEKNQVRNGIAVVMGDTRNYYVPAEEFAKNWNYPSMCRMPGLLPVYVPLYWMLGPDGAWVGMVVVQFLFSVLSALLLAIIAARMLGGQYTFVFTALLYALSSFVSIWDHTLMADSLSTSTLICSVYFLSRYIDNKNLTSVLLCSLMLTWSVFLRQIAVVLFPVFVLILLVFSGITMRNLVRNTISLCLIPVMCISVWTWRNYKREGLIVPFIKPVESCYVNYSSQYITISRLLIVWGFDIQHWHRGTPAQWFSETRKQTVVFEGADRLETSVCNNDSIIALQHAYVDFRLESDSARKVELGDAVLDKCADIKGAYIAERPIDFYLVNRLILLRRFLLPERLDNLPGPALSDMSFFQKAVKLIYYGALLFVNVAAFLITVYWLLKRKWRHFVFALIPWSLAGMLAMILGFVEQRYLVPVYPFFLVMTAYTAGLFLEGRIQTNPPQATQ